MKAILAFLFSIIGLGILFYVFYSVFYLPLADPNQGKNGMSFPLIDLVQLKK
jgi:hypothetical protein